MLAGPRDLNSRESRAVLSVIARALAGAIVLLAATTAAHADEIRMVPAAGVKLTYRIVSTTSKVPDKPRYPGQLFTLRSGQVFTYIVTKSDGTTAEGVIKPDAVIIYCKDGASDHFCDEPAARPGAHFDGELLTVPVDSDIGDALSKHSFFKLNRLLMLSRVYAAPASRDPKADNHDFGPEPGYTVGGTLQCDDLTKLDDFLPFGKTQRVILNCEDGFERSASRDGSRRPLSRHTPVTIEITYTGSGSVTVPSGTWQVEKYTTAMTPKDPAHQSGAPEPLFSETETMFSTQLGVPVSSHRVGHTPDSQFTGEGTVELIDVSQ